MSPSTSQSASAPTSTPLPNSVENEANGQKEGDAPFVEDSSLLSNRESSQLRLRLTLEDITDTGSALFLSSVTPSTLLPSAVARVQTALYGTNSSASSHRPNIRSVTLIVRPMTGVAYTTGNDLDPELHKEIHFSSHYIASISPDRRDHEIEGVIVHELVHCFQYNGQDHAPGGLIEGIADWVRLKANLAPPHWRRGEELNGKWDAGYQHTGYFLEYLEKRFGEDTVRRLNEGLRVSKYKEKSFWTTILGRPVEQLWEDYKKAMSA